MSVNRGQPQSFRSAEVLRPPDCRARAPGFFFTGDETKLDCSNRVFPEDPTLSPFLESLEAKLAYIQVSLIPFIQRYSPADCRRALMNPTDEIREATRRVVAQMANGGIHPPS